MPEHPPQDLIRTLDSVRSALVPLSAVSRAINSNPDIRAVLAAANRSHEALRPMLGPVEDLRRSGLLAAAGHLASELATINQLTAEFQRRYWLPALAETFGYLQSPELRAVWKTLDRTRDHTTALQRVAASLTAPWLDTARALHSVSGFCELQGIGHQLRQSAAFESGVADRLRLVLGDWRPRVDWPAPMFTDPLARSDFYLVRGLDPDLTAFPAKAFDQIAISAGLKDDLPSLLSDYSRHIDADDPDEEAGFVRTNAAHDRLQRFETHVRRFIERKLRSLFGDDWIRQRVPPPIRQDWRDKQQRARDHGEPERPLVAYADFTHYEQIILRKGNWEQAFAPVFKRRTLVQESFQRLYPIRVCTMHARIVTQDDELFLYVETKRLLAAIGIPS